MKEHTPNLISHDVGVESTRKVAENDAWCTLWKFYWESLVGATEILANKKWFLKYKNRSSRTNHRSRNWFLEKMNEVITLWSYILPLFPYI